MKKAGVIIKNIAISLALLTISFSLSIIMQNANIGELITTLFVFAVFVISYLTDGYIYGIAASVVACVAVNYVFTFPYFKFSLSLPVNIISAIAMIVISALTSALVTNIRRHDMIRAESENESMRNGSTVRSSPRTSVPSLMRQA